MDLTKGLVLLMVILLSGFECQGQTTQMPGTQTPAPTTTTTPAPTNASKEVGMIITTHCSFCDDFAQLRHFPWVPGYHNISGTVPGIGFSNTYIHFLSVDVDFRTKQIYLYDYHLRAIAVGYGYHAGLRAADLDFEFMFVGVSRGVIQVAVDYITHTVYCVDPVYKHVFAAPGQRNKIPLDYYRILVEKHLSSPDGLALDVLRQRMFVSDRGNNPQIKSYTMTGENPTIIVSTGLHSPGALETDIFEGRLYWLDYHFESINSVKYDGTGRRRLKIIEYSSLFDLGIFKDILIVTDTLNDYMYTMNKTTGEKKYRTLRLGNETMYGIAMYDIETQPLPTKNADPCAALECEQLCLLNGTGAVCMCSEGYEMNANGSCVTAPNSQAILIATTTQICLIDIRSLAHQAYTEDCVFTVISPPPTTTPKPTTTTMAPPPTPSPATTASPQNGTQAPNNASTNRPSTSPKSSSPASTTPAPTTPAPTAAPGDLIKLVDIDVAKRRIFYADASNKIHRRLVDLPRDNPYKELIVSPSGIVSGLAFDWIGDENLYWCESDTGRIYLVNVDDKAPWMVSDGHGSGLHDLVLLPHDRKLGYMVNNSALHTIGLRGSDHNVLKTGLSSAQYLVYEQHEKRFYWMNTASYIIYSMDFDSSGSSHQVFSYTQRNSAHLGIFQDYILWVYRSGQNEYLATYRKSVVSRVSLGYVTDLGEIVGIKFLARQAQPTEPNPCQYQNGYCEQICLTNSVNGKQEKMCVCSLGYTLAEDKMGCESVMATQNFCMMTDITQNAIYQVNMQNQQLQAFQTDDQGTYSAIMYQPYEKKFYFSNYDSGTLRRSNLDGTGVEDVYDNGFSYMESMVYDETSGNIYFTANDWTYVGMVTQKGQTVDLIDAFWDVLKGIAIHPKLGWLYYAVPEGEYGYASVMRANMDGTDITELITGDDVLYPYGVAIDYKGDHLYWSDTITNVIHKCNLDGTQCSDFVMDSGANITAIEINGDYLYYVALNNHHLTRVPLSDGTIETVFGSHVELGQITHLSVYVMGNEGKQPASESCKANGGKGDCSTICLPTSGGRACACDYGTYLKPDDPKTCEDIPQCKKFILQDGQEINFSRNCSRYIGAQCTFKCPTGWTPIKPDKLTLTCETDGWDREYETLCFRTLCPSTIPNGKWDPECERTVGESCRYSCSANFNPAFNNAVCTNTGDWSHDVSTLCTGNQCTAQIPNGALEIDCERTPRSPTCTFTCNPGFKKNPRVSTLTCMTNHQWNEDLKTLCLPITCPSSIQNGQLTACSDKEPGRKCDYSCYSGFMKPPGVSMITCLITETWDAHGQKPCIAMCTKYQFTCGDGSCIDATKKCDGTNDCPDKSDESKTTCPPMCPNVYSNGALQNNCPRLVGQPCMITCNNGFSNGGINTVVCSSKMMWTPEQICEPITCPDMLRIGSLDPTCGKGFNQLCAYNCPPGFGKNATVGSIKCLENAQWNQTTKLCLAISVTSPQERSGGNDAAKGAGIAVGVIVCIIIIVVLVGYIIYRRKQSYKETPYSMSFSNSNSNVAIENPGYTGSTPATERRTDSDYDNINTSQMQPTKFVEDEVPVDHGMVNPMFMEKHNAQLPEVGQIGVTNSSISYKDWQGRQMNEKSNE